ncbi:ABC transporter permease [Gottfriedia acidiceleris]|uniref:ABC transporter permease n=1 Tax=Gottfriedia acidiceleris TaxID=371036 RepID=UPI002FFF0441
MNSLKTVLTEHFKNLHLIKGLSSYEMKKEYADNILGSLWVFLNPLMQIAVFWFVFGTGIRGGAPVHGVPFIIWMLCGLIPWFFISTAIINGSASIYARVGTVSKMNFPLSIIPTYVVLSRFYTHLVLVVVLLIAVISSQGMDGVHIFALIYYMFSNLMLLIALAFLTSTLSTMLRDIHLFLQQFTRMLMYLTPVLWMPNPHQTFLLKIMKINPFFYIATGYRDSLLNNSTSLIFSSYSFYYWGVVLVILILGAALHIKFRKMFVDYL